MVGSIPHIETTTTVRYLPEDISIITSNFQTGFEDLALCVHHLSSTPMKDEVYSDAYMAESVFIASAFLPWTDENTVTPAQPNFIDSHTQIMTNCPQCTSEIRRAGPPLSAHTVSFHTNFRNTLMLVGFML